MLVQHEVKLKSLLCLKKIYYSTSIYEKMISSFKNSRRCVQSLVAQCYVGAFLEEWRGIAPNDLPWRKSRKI